VAGVSIHAPLARSDLRFGGNQVSMTVSIHAPLARSDLPQPGAPCTPHGFNPRSPREERPSGFRRGRRTRGFNPRSPREERPGIYPCRGGNGSFNPRSPREERLPPDSNRAPKKAVSIHAPLARSDVSPVREITIDWVSIHAPLARSDYCDFYGLFRDAVSIHAPLARSDLVATC